MNGAEIREEFLRFVGPETFRDFIRALHPKEQRAGLRFWQERCWQKFRDHDPAVPSSEDEIRKAMLWCFIHERAIVEVDPPNWIPNLPQPPGWDSDLKNSFPFCFGGYVCPDCVSARDNTLAEFQKVYVPPPPAVVDWPALSECLFRISVAEIADFAAKHPDKEFYGFAFDGHSYEGRISVCLNTKEALRDIAMRFKTEERPLGYKGLDPRPIEEIEEGFRWDLGAWKYQCFESGRFQDEWEPFESAIWDVHYEQYERGEVVSPTETQVRFMEVVCEVLFRLEDEGKFAPLRRTSDFQLFASDHEEFASEKEPWERMAAVRAKLANRKLS